MTEKGVGSVNPSILKRLLSWQSCLSALAKKYYGNAMDTPPMFEANREVIEDREKIYMGQKIRMPLE